MGKKTDAIAALFAAITERKPAAVCYAPEEDYGAFWARHAADAETIDIACAALADLIGNDLGELGVGRLRSYIDH